MKINLKAKLQNYYIVVLITGFLVASLIPQLIGVDIGLGVMYRTSVVLFSILIISINLFSFSYKRQFNFLILFLIIYFCSVVFDLYISQIRLWPGRNPSYYLQYLTGAVIFPILGLVFVNYRIIDFNFILNRIYIILFAVLLLSIYLRIGSSVEGRDIGDLNIGVLLYGQYGATLCILSMYKFFNTKNTLKNLLYILGYVIGFLSIFISASRSPLLVLLLITIIFALTRLNKFKAVFLIGFLSLLMYLFFIDILSFIGNYIDSSFLDRIIYAIQGVSTGRESLVQTGFLEFLNAPLFGNAFLLQTGYAVGIYPHNLIVEAFMALGFFGGGLFLIIIVKSLVKVFAILNTKKSNYMWVGLLYLQFLIFGMFSGSLYMSDLFWINTTLIAGIFINERPSLPKTIKDES